VFRLFGLLSQTTRLVTRSPSLRPTSWAHMFCWKLPRLPRFVGLFTYRPMRFMVNKRTMYVALLLPVLAVVPSRPSLPHESSARMSKQPHARLIGWLEYRIMCQSKVPWSLPTPMLLLRLQQSLSSSPTIGRLVCLSLSLVATMCMSAQSMQHCCHTHTHTHTLSLSLSLTY
jgi:hypothetical protein